MLLFISQVLSFLDGGNAPIFGLLLLIDKLMEKMQTVDYVPVGCYRFSIRPSL